MRLVLTLLSLLMMSTAAAHPLAPALLDIKSTGDGHYDVLWRLSAVQMRGIAPQPIFPDHCQRSSAIKMQKEAGTAVASQWQMRCEGGTLINETIAFSGLDRNPINVVLRFEHHNGSLFQILLDARTPGTDIPPPESSTAVFNRYLSLGIEHLILGPDHLLFLLALILLIGLRRKLIWVLTAFTLGHSVTLSLASLDLIKVNAGLMEFGIALTLVIAARELLGSKAGWMGRYPAMMAAAFGLLHGLGFAGALADIGLPQMIYSWPYWPSTLALKWLNYWS